MVGDIIIITLRVVIITCAVVLYFIIDDINNGTDNAREIIYHIIVFIQPFVALLTR